MKPMTKQALRALLARALVHLDGKPGTAEARLAADIRGVFESAMPARRSSK
jgi:hypothetical protein